jgi:hypothetical protein
MQHTIQKMRHELCRVMSNPKFVRIQFYYHCWNLELPLLRSRGETSMFSLAVEFNLPERLTASSKMMEKRSC